MKILCSVLRGVLLIAVLVACNSLQPTMSAEQLTAAAETPPVFDPAVERLGFDPLSEAEQARAWDLVRQNPDFLKAVPPEARQAVLLIERHAEEKSVTAAGTWARRADVFVYNYTADTLVLAIVNLETQRVDEVETLPEAQLPFTEEETQAALQLILADPVALEAIGQAYTAITQKTLQNPQQQLTPYAFTYNALILPDVPTALVKCGVQRCAEMMLLENDTNQVLNVPMVVNLSTSELFLTPP